MRPCYPTAEALSRENAVPDYRVVRKGALLGTVTPKGSDMPWWKGDFDPAPGFESIRQQFDWERDLLSTPTRGNRSPGMTEERSPPAAARQKASGPAFVCWPK